MPTQTTITLFLKGLLAIFVNEDKTLCTVGVLKDPPPGHELTISVKKGAPGSDPEKMTQEVVTLTRPEVRDALRLDVHNTSQTNITFRKKDAAIDRQSDPNNNPATSNRDSFNWVVDLENHELYDGSIGAASDGFRPTLTFNGGELFTASISMDKLFIQRGIFSCESFGFVANKIGVKFSLDQADSRARFSNGGETVFESEADTDYVIEIVNDADVHSGIVTDAN
ncbi:MAG: hypothetical protein M3362_11290, partial [Acidobacteriota bacterium]|nr:hypothetical protein [Acidobacteriota bacterium]